MTDSNNDRRYKANLQGLLKFCTEATKTEDVSKIEAMSPEKREWLKRALEGMTSNDPVKQMIEALRYLVKSEGDKKDWGEEAGVISLEDREVALENLTMFCEDLDLATDFYNIGGFEVLASLLQDKRLSIKVAAAELIATFVQNNPFCQQKVLEDPFLLTHLLSRVQDDGEEAELRIKCLYAVSCTVRESQAAQDRFTDLDGFKVIQKVIQSSKVTKLKVKSLFLLGALCVERDRNKVEALRCGLVADVVATLGNCLDHVTSESGDRQVGEMAVWALHGMVAGSHGDSVLECLKVDTFKGVVEAAFKKWQELEGGQDTLELIEGIRTCCML